jgi:hypothetical protein
MKFTTILKSTIALIFIIGFTFNSNAQESSQWKLSDKSVFTYNGTVINSKTTSEEINTTFGEPSSEKTYPNGDILYLYNSLGISISTNARHKVNFVGFNYTWDGDKRFPETSFEGSLQVGDFSVTKESTSKDFEKIDGIEFKCPIPLMCASMDKKSNLSILIGFQDNSLTQIGFIFE